MFERALAIATAAERQASEIAEAERALAAALWPAGGDRERSAALMLGARARLSAADPEAPRIAEIDAWLARREIEVATSD